MNKKQIEEKSEELVRTIRLYIIGVQTPHMVKNALNCLFVDILLDQTTKETRKELNLGWKKRGNFEQLLEEWNS